MSSPSHTYGRLDRLPWSHHPEENRRLNRFLFACLFPALLAGAIIPQLPKQTVEPIALPDQKTQLIKLRFEPKPPPPPIIEPAPLPDPTPAPTAANQPTAAATSAARTATAKAPQKKKPDRTAELKRSLQKLRENPSVLASVSNRPLQKTVNQSQPQNERLSAELDQGAPLTGQATPERSRGSQDLSGYASTQVAAPASGNGRGESSRKQKTGDGGSGRSSQEIQSTFDRNKSAINAVYERALRNNPELAGKLVFRLRIEPSGTVSECTVLSNGLGDDELADRIARRIKRINFGAKQVPEITLDYPIEFFPR